MYESNTFFKLECLSNEGKNEYERILLLLSRESEPFNNLIFELNYEYFDSILVFASMGYFIIKNYLNIIPLLLPWTNPSLICIERFLRRMT